MRIGYLEAPGIAHAIKSTPTLIALRQLFPNASIECVVSEIGRAVLSGWSLVDKLVMYHEKDLEDTLFVRGLGCFDILLVGYPGTSSSERIAQFTERIVAHLPSPAFPLQHEVLMNIALVRRLGWEGDVPETYIHVDDRSERFIDKELGGLLRGAVVIHPGCSRALWRKRWPKDHWVEFCCRLREEVGAPCVVLGGPEEVDVCEDICGVVPWAVNLCDCLSIKEVAAALRRARLLVSNDSGLGHVAAAVGTPVISLFGPTPAERCRPWSSASVNSVIHSQVECAPCFGRHDFDRCEDNMCMQCIGVDEVMRAVHGLLNREERHDVFASACSPGPYRTTSPTQGELEGIIDSTALENSPLDCHSRLKKGLEAATTSAASELCGTAISRFTSSQETRRKHRTARIAPRIAILMLVKDEADIVKESMTENLKYTDLLLVLDTGSTDGTAEICEEMLGRDAVRKTRQLYSETLRNRLIEWAADLLSHRDWLFLMDADEFFDQDPRPFVLAADRYGAFSMKVRLAQFYLTHQDLERLNANPRGEGSRPIKDRLLWYSLNWTEIQGCRNLPGIACLENEPCPTRWERGSLRTRIWQPGPIARHYQFRTPEQIQRRLDIRLANRAAGAVSFEHYDRDHWRSYVINSSLLQKFDGQWQGPGIPLKRLLIESHLISACHLSTVTY